MSEDLSASSALLAVAPAETPPLTGYSRVKAVEAIGRLRAATGPTHLSIFAKAEDTALGEPHEVRLAALQAVYMIDRRERQASYEKWDHGAGALPGASRGRCPRIRGRGSAGTRILPLKPMAAVANSKRDETGLEIFRSAWAVAVPGGKTRLSRWANRRYN